MDPRLAPADPMQAAPAPMPATRSDWLWCFACERVYPRTGAAALEPCPHVSCKGSASRLFAWDWHQVLRAHPGYPARPVPGAVYHWLEG